MESTLNLFAVAQFLIIFISNLFFDSSCIVLLRESIRVGDDRKEVAFGSCCEIINAD